MPALVKCALGKMRTEDVAARVGKSPTANGVNMMASLRVVQPGIGAGLPPCLSPQLGAAEMFQR
jgi:hypothetical protein